MKVSEEEAATDPYMLSSANWIVAGGSLEDSICFETSNTKSVEVFPTGVLFERPSHSPPCEITIFFREKHEIHSIYVRSTARVFEVYYASDKEVLNNEYLCTVRCEAAVEEMKTATGEMSQAECSQLNGINANFSRSNGCSFIEDGWIEVKAIDSLNNGRLSMPNVPMENSSLELQIKYEATAQISNASPCISVTLRLLSLKAKASIFIDEIYIYADPVEDIDPNSPTSNGRAESLLSMLIPGFLQLSKPESSRLLDNGFSEALEGPKCASTAKETIHSTIMGNFKFEEKLEHSQMESTSKTFTDLKEDSKTNDGKNDIGCDRVEKHSILKHTQINPMDGKLRLVEEDKKLGQPPLLMNAEDTSSNVCIENILNDLVSRVGKIENFYSRFEESIRIPITRIEMKLQLLDERLDVISKASFPCKEHFSASEFGIENDGPKTSLETVDSRAGSHEKTTAVGAVKVSLSEAEKCSGLMVKEPEFFNNDGEFSNISFVEFSLKETPKNVKHSSIDSALASVLTAFATSTAEKSSSHNSHPKDAHNEQKNCDDRLFDPTIAVNSDSGWFFCHKNCDMSYEARHDEMCLNELYFSDVIDSTINNFDKIDRKGAQIIGNYLCEDDNSPVEIDMHETKGLVIRAPEFPSDDDILDYAENSDFHSRSYPDSHSNVLPHHQLELSTSNQNSISLSAFKAQEVSDKIRTGLENCINTSIESSLEGFCLSQSSTEQQINFFHNEAEIAEDNYAFIHHSTDEANHVLKCNNLLAGRSNNCTQNEFSYYDKFEVSGSKTKSWCDSSFIRSQLHYECSDSNSVEPIIGTYSAFDYKQIPSYVPSEDELTSYAKFCADENLNSWLPLELLLCEKHNKDSPNDTQLELAQKHIATNLAFSVNFNSRCELPPQILNKSLFDEDNAYHTLLDMNDNAVQTEISSHLKADALNYTECLNNGNLIFSLI